MRREPSIEFVWPKKLHVDAFRLKLVDGSDHVVFVERCFIHESCDHRVELLLRMHRSLAAKLTEGSARFPTLADHFSFRLGRDTVGWERLPSSVTKVRSVSFPRIDTKFTLQRLANHLQAMHWVVDQLLPGEYLPTQSELQGCGMNTEVLVRKVYPELRGLGRIRRWRSGYIKVK